MAARLTAAVMATAAAAVTAAGVAVSAAGDEAVRAEMAVAARERPLDVGRIRIVDALTPGESYRLPSFGVRNHHRVRTAYRLVVSYGAAQRELRPPRRWVHLEPAAAVIDPGRSRAVQLRLEVPRDAEPGEYAVVLGVRPGGRDAARLTFRVEPTDHRDWVREAPTVALWLVPALLGAGLSVALVRIGA